MRQTLAPPPKSLETLPPTVESLLEAPGTPADRLSNALAAIAAEFAAPTATLHRADEGARLLHMVAHRGLPERLVPLTAKIPFGKGMAGVCVERREPVTVCNLQTDASGIVRPGAKETGVAGAISVPIFGAEARLLGTFGIGKPGEHDYSAEETATLVECARLMAPLVAELGGEA